MINLDDFVKSMEKINIVNSIIVIIISIIIYKSFTYFLNKGEEKNKLKIFTNKKSKTYIKLIRSIVRYVFIIVTILIILQINGVDVSSLLAGVGILGVVLGLAIQDWLKDIIRGSSILSDNYFSVGDIVKYKDFEGKVLIIGLKTTKIQDIRTNNIISIANRNIEQVELVSNLVYINIPMPYDLDVEEAEKAIDDIIQSIQNNEHVDNCRYLSVNELSDSSVKYLVEITCSPTNKLQVRRDALRSILVEMKNNNINVPYTQIDIHEK